MALVSSLGTDSQPLVTVLDPFRCEICCPNGRSSVQLAQLWLSCWLVTKPSSIPRLIVASNPDDNVTLSLCVT